MGTRHLQTVINKDGEVKVRQYGQWDGYPSGQGLDILQYLRTADLDKYQANLTFGPITDEQADSINREYLMGGWQTEYPYMHRNCGAKIHQMIEAGVVQFVSLLPKEEDYWCEGFYVINFQDMTFTTNYYDKEFVCSLTALPQDEEYLAAFNDVEEEDEY